MDKGIKATDCLQKVSDLRGEIEHIHRLMSACEGCLAEIEIDKTPALKFSPQHLSICT